MTNPETLDPRWPRLLVAARAWRARLGTGISSSGSTARPLVEISLLEAIAAFDEDLRSGHEHPG